ncbi:MAG: hypothetical protein JJU20_06945 [Opitutales bacterium]|nr:hypothetical protein [Opitutales bacterium]
MISNVYQRRSSGYSEIAARTAILATYERLVEAVKDEQRTEAVEIINGMRCSMDMSKNPAFVLGMERIYRHCIVLIQEGNYKSEVVRVLEHLKSVWELALSKNK